MKCFLFLIFLLIVTHIGLAQRSSFINYSMDNGLTSNEVYDILEDKKGFLWFATDKGLSKYNGYEFERFTLQQGLPDNTILGFFEDKKGRIWLRSLNGILSYLENDSVHLVLPKTAFGQIYSLYVDQLDTIWLSTASKQYKVFSSVKGEYISELLPISCLIRKIDTTRSGILTGIISQKKDDYYKTNGKVQLANLPPRINKIKLPRSINVYNLSPNESWMDLGRYLVSLSTDSISIIQEFKDRDILLSITNRGEVFIGGVGGVQTLKQGRLGKVFLQKKTVTRVLQDCEGGYWFSTLAHGVFYTSNLAVKAYNLKADNKIIKLAKSIDGSLTAYGRFGDVYVETISGFSKIYDNKIDRKQYGDIAHYAKENSLRAYGTNRLNIKRLDKRWRILHPYVIRDKYELRISSSDLLLVEKRSKKIHTHRKFPQRLKSLKVYRHKDAFYIPTMKGLYSWDMENDLIFYGAKHSALSQRVNGVCVDKQQRVWIATNNDGIFMLDGENLLSINSYHKSMGGICRNIVCGERYIWASSENGLIKIDQIGFNKVEKFTIRDGMLSNDITAMFMDSAVVVLGHPTGITKFPIDYKRTYVAPPIYVSNVSISRKQRPILSHYNLKYNSGLISISYTGISYNSELRYKYRLQRKNEEWTYTSERNVQFISLSPGTYTFEVYAINSMGMTSTDPCTLKFTISPPFWNTWWFWGIGILGMGIGITAFIRYRLKKLRIAVDIERKLIDVEQQALRARMNPHFIFNSLNSIQLYILENDKRGANKYLSSFSKLIRSILDNSNKKLISIEKESEIVESYLFLESLRFKEKVEYEIKITPSLLNANYKIPPLLLQPYAENAIRHGIMHKSTKGWVKVHISDLGDSILCCIEDNGVGREKAKEIKERSPRIHQSSGMGITANRIDLMQELYGGGFSLKIIDLKKEGVAIGTRIEIRIPYLN